MATEDKSRKLDKATGIWSAKYVLYMTESIYHNR